MWQRLGPVWVRHSKYSLLLILLFTVDEHSRRVTMCNTVSGDGTHPSVNFQSFTDPEMCRDSNANICCEIVICWTCTWRVYFNTSPPFDSHNICPWNNLGQMKIKLKRLTITCCVRLLSQLMGINRRMSQEGF